MDPMRVAAAALPPLFVFAACSATPYPPSLPTAPSGASSLAAPNMTDAATTAQSPPAQRDAPTTASQAPSAEEDPFQPEELRAADAAHAWLVTRERIYAVSLADGAMTDRTPYTSLPPHAVISLIAPTPRRVLVLVSTRSDAPSTEPLHLFVSRDAGVTWREHDVPQGAPSRGSRLSAGRGETFYVLSSDANGMNSHADQVLASSDDGAHFRTLGTKTGYGDIAVQSMSALWTIGTCCASTHSVYRSRDGGQTWALALTSSEEVTGRAPATTPPQSQIVFKDESHGFFVRVKAGSQGPESVLAVTGDGGKTWKDVPPPRSADYVAHASARGVVLLEGQHMLATSDLGATWRALPDLAGSAAIVDVTPLDGGAFIAVVQGADRRTQVRALAPNATAWTTLSGP